MSQVNKKLNITNNMTPKEKALAYSNFYNIPYVDLKEITIEPELFDLIPKSVALEHQILAYQKNEIPGKRILKLAIANADILQKKAPDFITKLKRQGWQISLAITTADELEEIINNHNIKPNYNAENKPRTKYPTITLIGKKIPIEILKKFPKEIAEKYQIVVFEASGEEKIEVAAISPEDQSVTDILEFIKKRNHLEIELFKTSSDDIQYALKLYQENPQVQFAETGQPKIKYSSNMPQPIIEETKEKIQSSVQLNSSVDNFQNKISEIDATKPITEASANSSNSKEAIPTIEIGASEIKNVEVTDNSLASVTGEEENNLDKLLPTGIQNVQVLADIIKNGVVPKIIAAIIYYAIKLESSDIHLEPTREDFHLRYRIDGMLKDILVMPLMLHAPLASRIKIISGLKIDEQRIPQDGRFDIIAEKREIDLRVSTLPTSNGEKVVMRILDKSGGIKNIEDLGITGTNLKRLSENITKPYGIILATGPTGSGKSTTLYAILNRINLPDVNIITLEDPVEYDIPGVNQCQIRPDIGFGFAEGLRSILRQDPNKIMVGEIRDSETASLSTHAALTGQLVLTTLHTNNAASALPRLINMGIEPFLITSSINCIVAQRLVRKICNHCKEEVSAPQGLVEEIKKELSGSRNVEVLEYQNKPIKFYRGKGCPQCNLGYHGRTGIYEVIILSEAIEDLAVNKAPANRIFDEAVAEGMVTMRQDGIIKVINGITTIDEVLRVTAGD